MRAFVTVKFYVDLDPVERYERFHKPLDELLRSMGLGEVTGGGTLSDLETDEAIYSDLHVQIEGDIDEALVAMRRALLSCGAPIGTQLQCESTGLVIDLTSH